MTTKRTEENQLHFDAILDNNFMCRIHRTNMEKALKTMSRKFLISFRAAGPFSIEKLSYGAAAKPHTILDKTIKPSDLPTLPDEFKSSVSVIDKTSKICSWETYLIRFLYGLVGVRDGENVCGLYLSENGLDTILKAIWKGADVGDLCFSALDKPFIQCKSTTNLIKCLRNIWCAMSESYYIPKDHEFKESNMFPKSFDKLFQVLSPLFITGDYDLHDLHIKSDPTTASFLERLTVKTKNELGEMIWRQPAADSDEEASCLYTLAMSMCDGKAVSTVKGSTYVPEECCPIQHGVQTAYIDHMFHMEQGDVLVSKVLCPDTYIAVYNSETEEWHTISLSEKEWASVTDPMQTQMDKIKDLYDKYDAPCFIFWDKTAKHAQMTFQSLPENTPLGYKKSVEQEIETYKLKYASELSAWLTFQRDHRAARTDEEIAKSNELKTKYVSSKEQLEILQHKYRILEQVMWKDESNNKEGSDK